MIMPIGGHDSTPADQTALPPLQEAKVGHERLGFVVVGTALAPDRIFVLLYDLGSGERLIVRDGDMVGGWTVEVQDANSVLFRVGNVAFERLVDPHAAR